MIIIAVVLVAAFGIGAYFYNSSKKSGTRATTNANTNRQAANVATIPANAPPGAQPPNFLGSPAATVTIEEFADYQCGACAQIHPIMKQLQSMYSSRIRFVFRNFPLSSHDKAYDAAAAAEAAGLQGSDKYWAMQNMLFTNQREWSAPNSNHRQLFRSYAEKIGLDAGRWETDALGLQSRNRVQADLDRGRAIGVSSTPTIYINGKMVPYPDMNLQTLRQIVDSELQASAPQNQSAQPARPAAPAPGGSESAPANK